MRRRPGRTYGRGHERSSTELRKRLLSGASVTEHEVLLAGVSTAVVQGGQGPPLVLLHGPGGSAVHWARVLPRLAATNP